MIHTVVGSKESVNINLNLGGSALNSSHVKEASEKSCFYDFAADYGMRFAGYISGEEAKSRFAESFV